MLKTAICMWPAWWRRPYITKTLFVRRSNEVRSRGANRKSIVIAMNLTMVLLTAAFLNVSANGLSQKVSFSGKNVPLTRVFSEVEKQTGYVVSYIQSILAGTHPVSVQMKDIPLEEFLQNILADQPIKYTIDAKTILLSRKSPAVDGSSERQHVSKGAFDLLKDTLITVRGRILNEKGEPMSASVIVKGSAKGATTDSDGYFQIVNVDGQSTLVVSGINIETQTIILNGKKDFTINAVTKIGAEREVVINAGYYSVKDRERTGNISRISSAEIEKQPVTNPLAAMQGRMAGVNIVQNTGVPGGGFTVQIRGRNSIRNEGNNPLYIVDGVPFSAEILGDSYKSYISTGIMGSDGLNPLNTINPADIESIEVLKDGDATAIYGSRGSNGVVLITTKKGKAGKTKLTLNAYTGAGKVTRFAKLMTTSQYITMAREAFANDGITEYPDWAYAINGTWDTTRYTDWQKTLIGGTAKTYQIQVGVSGGSENTQFLINSTVYRETTVFPGDYAYRKGAVHVDLRHRSVNNKFKLNFSANYMLDKNNLVGEDFTFDASRLEPNAPALYNTDGKLNWEGNTWQNPLRNLQRNYQAKNNTLISSAVFSYEFIRGITFKTNLGYTTNALDEIRINPSTIYNPVYNVDSRSSNMGINNSKQQLYIAEPQLSWDHSFKNSQIQLLVGATYQEQRRIQYGILGSGFSSNAFIRNIAAATYTTILNNTEDIYKYSALFTRLNYNFRQKYVLNITGRRDGSSRFGPGKRFGNFGAMGGAWIFSKEEAVTSALPFLSFGKLRASYGTTGSDQIGDYQYLDTYLSMESNYQNLIGLDPSRLSNPDFGWETNKKFEVALETGILQDRIFLSIAYFRNRSSSQLVGVPLPGTTGFNTIQANLGATVQNTGFEVEMRTVNIQRKQFTWTTSVNITAPQNKLIDFPGLATSTYSNTYVIGEPLNIKKVYHYTGVDKTTGIYTFEDINRDGITSSAGDRKLLINTAPKFFGGLVNNFTFKQIQIDFLLQFVKQTGYNYVTGYSLPGLGIQPAELADRWQKPGDDAPLQKYTAGFDDAASLAYARFQVSDGALTDASFIRLKNVSVSYNFNQQWLGKADCSIYFQAQNLVTITSYRGADPENKSSISIPPLRMLTCGIKFGL